MIFVNRSAVPPPSRLLHFQQQKLQEMEVIFSQIDISHTQRRPDFLMPSSLAREVRHHLTRLFNGKCAYCERAAKNIDHFRPKWRASRLDRQIDPDHYWWLFADWNNLFLCCHDCNSRKANAFPIERDPAPQMSVGAELRAESPLLVNPCEDQPEEHLCFESDGGVVARSRKGEFTIQLFELNNPYLVMARKASAALATRECNDLWMLKPGGWDEKNFRLVIESKVADLNHLAAVRAAIDDFINSEFNIESEYSEYIVQADDVPLLPKTVWLDKMKICNFKSIAVLDLEFPRPDELWDEYLLEDEAQELSGEAAGQSWLMVLGENGVGKSSLLQAIALALMPDKERDDLGRPSSWLRRQEGGEIKNGYVRLTFSDGTLREIGFRKGVSKFVVSGEIPPMAVLAYGSTRLLPHKSRKKDHPARISVRNLFNNRHPLSSTERYLCDANAIPDKQFNILAGSLKSLLPIMEDSELTRDGKRLSVRVAGRTVTLDRLSDGYKSMLALAMDIMFHLTDSTYDMESATGLVLVDELELHLHPRWKVAIVRQLRTLFPNVRFIVSTHDPLCVLGLRSSELHVLTADPATQSIQADQIDVPKGARADEVLTGPWFGVASTIDSHTQRLMDEHSRLLVRSDSRPYDESRRRELEDVLRQRLNGFATTRAQRAMLAAAAALNPARPTSHIDHVLQHRLSGVLSSSPMEPRGAPSA